MSNRANPKLVGTFVMLAVALAVVAVVIFSSDRLFRKTHEFIVFFNGSVAGLRTGSPVKFRGVEIGSVVDVRISMPGTGNRESTRIPVIFDIDARRLSERGGSADRLENRAAVDSLIDRGLRAVLEMESLVTGRRYIELDMLPGTPLDLVADPGVKYQEIPPAQTGLEEIQKSIERVINSVGSMDVDGMLASIKGTFDSLRLVVSDPSVRRALHDLPAVVVRLDSTLASFDRAAQGVDSMLVPWSQRVDRVADQAEATLAAAERSFDTVQRLLNPDSPLAVQLTRLLQEVAASARSTRELTEYLERNPGSLLRGKPKEND